MNPIQQMTDAELDAAYAAAWDNGNFTGAQILGVEIIARMSTIGGILAGALNGNQFPLYNARSNFSQSQAAQSSISSAAGDVAVNIVPTMGNTITSVADTAGNTLTGVTKNIGDVFSSIGKSAGGALTSVGTGVGIAGVAILVVLMFIYLPKNGKA